jgi:hypothetical protein
MPPRHGVSNMEALRIDKFYINDEEMNRQILEVIDNSGDRMNYKTNCKAYMTKWDMSNQPGFNKLAEIILKKTNELALKYYGKTEDYWLRSLWGIKYKSGEYALPHHHLPAIWASAYYINPPIGSPGLIFTDYNVELQPKHSTLYIFPAKLGHEVRPKEFDGYRYTVAGSVHLLSDKEKYDARDAKRKKI